jgi:hypothetical protein
MKSTFVARRTAMSVSRVRTAVRNLGDRTHASASD